MKFLSLLILSATLLASVDTFACAGCLDIYTEVVVLDSATTQGLVSKSSTLKSGGALTLSNISCSKEKYSEVSTCRINRDSQTNKSELTLSGEAALALYSKLSGLTVEIDRRENESEDNPIVRTGERVRGVLLTETEEKSTVQLAAIHVGSLSCPIVNKEKRCEVELRILTMGSIP